MATRQRGTTWQADLQHKGQRYRESFATEAEATAWEAKAREALKAGKPLPSATPQPAGGGAYGTMQKLLDVVIATDWGRKRGCAGQISHAQRFVDFVGASLAPASALTQERVDAFITEELLPRHLSEATGNRYLSAISKLSTKAEAVGLIPRKLRMVWGKEGEARLRWFSDEEEALILQTLRLWSLPEWHDFFVLLGGHRSASVARGSRLRWDAISKLPRMATLQGDTTKNGKSRAVPLTARAAEAIERQRGRQEGPFCHLGMDAGQTVYERLRAHLPQLEGTMWYTARHTFASRLVQRGVDLYRVQKLMGHANPQQTQRYAKLAPTHLIDAIAVLEPKRELRVVA
jgi:integrase